MKRKYLLALVLAGALTFANAPITANAASPNAGGTIVGAQQADAGDTLTIDDDGTPLAAPEEDAPEEASTESAPEGTPEETPEETPEDSAPAESTPEDVQLDDDETPLAVLSTDTQTKGGFTWWGFTVGVLTTGVAGTGVWAVLKVRKKGKK